MSQLAVAAIVPAYNEETTIGDVVRVLVASGAFREVIVVSDGSRDRTADRAHDAGATLVHQFSVNRGKAAALAAGLTHTDAPIVCFFDGDLLGLTSAHIAALVDPVVKGMNTMTIGIRDRHGLTNTFARMFKIGGQRALRREIFEKLPKRCIRGYKIETALTYFCEVNGLSYDIVTLFGLRFRRKIEKVGVIAGVFGYLKMSVQIMWTKLECRIFRQAFLR